jgi:hypothetical protein
LNTIDKLMNGSIDMHTHFGPESLVERRQDAIALANTAKSLGMRGLVLKNREYNTVPVAYLVNQLVPDFQVFGTLSMDRETGGINPAGVISALKMGAKIIWCPVFTTPNSRPLAEKTMVLKLTGESVTMLDASGKLIPEAKEVMQMIKEYDAIMATGHITPKEIFALAEYAVEIGFKKLLVTHALQAIMMLEKLTVEQMVELTKMGVYIEHSFWEWMPTLTTTPPELIVNAIKKIGTEYSIMSSDMGQVYNPPAPEGFRIFIATMLRKGLTESEIEMMVKTNPYKLLGLS